MNAVLLQRWAPIVKVVKSPGGYADDAFIERCEIEQVRATDRAEGPDQRLSRIGEQILIPRQCFFPFSYREALLHVSASVTFHCSSSHLHRKAAWHHNGTSLTSALPSMLLERDEKRRTSFRYMPAVYSALPDLLLQFRQ